MPHPGDSPGLTEIARRWREHLTTSSAESPISNSGRITVDAEALERALLSVAREADAQARTVADAAVRRFADLYSASPVGVVLGDSAGMIQDVNPALIRLLGFSGADLEGRPLSDLAATPNDAAAITVAVEQLGLPAHKPWQERLSIVHADDESLRARVTIATVTGETEGVVHPVLMIEDINELDLLSETLRKQHVQDPLTGLPNSHHFANQVDTALAAGEDGRIALLYFDIDGFKVINDGLGPGAGDAVLRHVARTLDQTFPGKDAVVARLSGDGFGVLLRDEVTSTGVIDLVEEAVGALAEPIYVDGKGVGVNVSVGIVVTATTGHTQQDLHRAAEITLHRAKENGKAQWMLFESGLDATDRRRFAIGAAIGGGLETGEFTVGYEPTVTLDGNGHVAVVNAVLRWDHPEHGVLTPSDFGSLADTTGMTSSLGHFLLSRALTDTAAWHDEFPGAPDLCMRLPTRFAIDPNLVRMVRARLRDTNLAPDKLHICTDSATLADPRGEVLETLSVLADLGVKITMTVTGAADLDLIRVHHLPVGFIILSGPLVDVLAEDTDSAGTAQRHLTALLEQARELGVTAVGADGVCSTEQAHRLRDLGVAAGRGKLFGEEVGADGVRRLLSGSSLHTNGMP